MKWNILHFRETKRLFEYIYGSNDEATLLPFQLDSIKEKFKFW